MLQIRPYRPEDRAGVRHVCVETAHLGSSIRPYFSDAESMADILTAYYTDQEPESAWVVSDGQRVLGYVLGCLDSRRAPDPAVVAMKRILARFLWIRPGTARFCFRAGFDAVRYLGQGPPAIDHARWPAHSHINLLPEARVGTLGMRLFRTWMASARERGASGLWGTSAVENTTSTLFHRALGFRPFGEPFPGAGNRVSTGKVMQLQVWVRDL